MIENEWRTKRKRFYVYRKWWRWRWKFEVIYEFEADGGNKYIFLVPADLPEEEEEAEVYVFRFDEQGDDIQLYPIEDDNEWDMIEEVFNTLDDEIDL